MQEEFMGSDGRFSVRVSGRQDGLWQTTALSTHVAHTDVRRGFV